MSPLAIDLAWSRPAPAAVHAAGYAGVIGYLSHDRTGKVFGDWKRYADEGLLISLVFEDGAGRAFGGFSAGAADATYANRQADDLGYPGQLLYYAADTDDRGMGGTGGVVEYCRGVQSAGGRGNGIYGSNRVVDDCLEAGVAQLGWQTVAWSAGRRSPRASLYQYARPVPLAGTDENEVLTDYWGQHTGSPYVPPKAKKQEEDMKGAIYAHSSGSWWFCRDSVRSYIGDPQTANVLAFLGQSTNNASQVPFVSDDVLSQFRDITTRGEVNA